MDKKFNIIGISIIAVCSVIGFVIVLSATKVNLWVYKSKMLEGRANQLCERYGYDSLTKITREGNYHAQCYKDNGDGTISLGDFDMCIPYNVGIACRK